VKGLIATIFSFALATGASAEARADDPLDVVIQGDPLAPRGARDATAASTTIRRDALTAPGATAADVLQAVPGVQVARTGGASDVATASIRGATSAETPIYLAGIRLNDDVTGTADLSRVPLWMIDRVEVYRGTPPADADRLGLGGAIFFEPAWPNGPKLGGGLEIGSFGDHAGWAGVAAGNAKSAALVGVRIASAKNDYPYLDDRGTRFDSSDDVVRRRRNADDTDVDVWALARTQLGTASITMVANAFHREQGVTGLGVVPSRAARGEVQRFLGGVTARVPCSSAGEERCAIELVSSAIVTDQELDDPLLELGLLTTEVHEAGARVGETARLRLRPIDFLGITASYGEEIERLAIDPLGGVETRARRITSHGALQVTIDPASWLELVLLGAFACEDTTGPPDPDAPLSSAKGACATAEPTARGGARATFGPLTLFGNAGRYERAPTLGELYGTSAAVRGNPVLVPETGATIDLGARVSASNSRFAASIETVLFSRFANDLIAYERSELGVVRPYNVSSARILGAEVAAAARAFDTVRFELAATSLDPRDTSANRTVVADLLPFQARLVAVPALTIYRDNVTSWLDRVSFVARDTYRASRVADPAGLVVLPAENSLDLEVAFFELGKHVAERVSVTDVLDTRNYDVLGLPLPGRAIYASVEAWWF
jgi:vitamin B12 transporter